MSLTETNNLREPELSKRIAQFFSLEDDISGVFRGIYTKTKRLQESLNKNQCFDAYLIKHRKLFVLVVDVHKANGLSYLLAKKEAYVRSGASSAEMTPTEMQSFPRERDVFGRELLTADLGSERGAY